MPSVSDSALLERMRTVARARRRLAALLTALMIAVYFGFLSLVAWSPARLGHLLVPGLSMGVLAGALVIACAWLLTWTYVHWTNAVYDPMVAEQRARVRDAARSGSPGAAQHGSPDTSRTDP